MLGSARKSQYNMLPARFRADCCSNRGFQPAAEAAVGLGALKPP